LSFYLTRVEVVVEARSYLTRIGLDLFSCAVGEAPKIHRCFSRVIDIDATRFVEYRDGGSLVDSLELLSAVLFARCPTKSNGTEKGECAKCCAECNPFLPLLERENVSVFLLMS